MKTIPKKHQEQNFQVKATIVVDVFGKPDTHTEGVLETLARMVYNEFGEGAHVQFRGTTWYYKDSPERTIEVDIREQTLPGVC